MKAETTEMTADQMRVQIADLSARLEVQRQHCEKFNEYKRRARALISGPSSDSEGALVVDLAGEL